LTSDLSIMGRSAHNIVSTAGNIGAVHVSSLAKGLTNACRANDAAAAARHQKELVLAYAAASRAIECRLSKLEELDTPQSGVRAVG
jgi:hypothetical protein